MLISHGKSDLYLYGNIAQGVAQLILLLAMARFGILWMVTAYVGSYFAFLLLWHRWVYRLIGMRLCYLARDVAPYLLITCIVFIGVYWLTRPITNLYLLLAAKIALSVALYAAALWGSGSVMFRESVQLLMKNKRKK